MNKLTGSCLCGAVTYKTTGPVLRFNVSKERLTVDEI